ncbi:GNAT family N-acetyltransferase [Mycoplasmatota bacterium]|nr:GNAT family N-acetyltransferase [Mycoplasmatota bacterium]
MKIRIAKKEDAEEIIHLVKKVIKEVDYFPLEAEDFDFTVEAEIEFIENTELFLVCEINGDLVGSSTLIRGKYKKTAHTALFGITILNEYTNSGIGTQILNYMIKHAKKNGIERIELEVFEKNISALKLYRKFGFEVDGKKENYIKTNKGYHNLLIMSKSL